LTALGKPTDRLVQGMDHIEFELEHGQLVDKGGQVVADPCSWAFRALAQNGYYRRPKGYVSAEEQALRDAEQEARALLDARQKAEQAQFEAWRDGLGEEAWPRPCGARPAGPRMSGSSASGRNGANNVRTGARARDSGEGGVMQRIGIVGAGLTARS